MPMSSSSSPATTSAAAVGPPSGRNESSIDRDATRGTYNATAPAPERNRDFARTLGRVLHRPAFMPTPAFALRAGLGSEMANEMLLGGQRVFPKRAQDEGFEFAYPELEVALKHALSLE